MSPCETSPIVNPAALEPLFMPWEFPNARRERVEREGGPAKIVIRRNFRDFRAAGILKILAEVYEFRNTYVAHQDEELRDVEKTRAALKTWINLLCLLHAQVEKKAGSES